MLHGQRVSGMAKKSELWQRLRAARAFADKTQGQVAKALSVTRPAVSLWESKTPDNRSNPSGEQLMEIARFLKIPAQYLVDDTVDANEIWNYGDRVAAKVPADSAPAERQGRAFWSAVEFKVLLERPEFGTCFRVHLPTSVIQLEAQFVFGKCLFGFAADGPSTLMTGVSALLYLERALGRTMSKHLLIWTRTGRFDIAQHAAYEKMFDTKIQSFNDVDKAARYIADL